MPIRRRTLRLFARVLPVLTVAVRSIRKPEMRAGLAALARIATQRPDLEPAIARALPELTLTSDL